MTKVCDVEKTLIQICLFQLDVRILLDSVWWVAVRVRVRARVMTSLNVREKKDFYERKF